MSQCTNDIFFLDWEKPRGYLGKHDAVPDALEEAPAGESSDEERGYSRRSTSTTRTSGRHTSGLGSRSLSRAATSRTHSGRARERKAPVSVWRTFLAANQWCDIQTQRQLDATLILVALIVLLDGAGLKFLATPQPDGDDLTPDVLNPALRFANTTTWWLVLAAGYWLWTWAVRDRFITEPPHEMFVDLCTMAKVSVFILDGQHHGYYLHCRSPYQHADGNMVELAEQLRKEEMQQLTGRGLKVRGTPHACLRQGEGRGRRSSPPTPASHSPPPSLPAARLRRRRADLRDVPVPRLAQPLRQDFPHPAPSRARQADQPGCGGHGSPAPRQWRGQRAARRVQGAAPPPHRAAQRLM